MNGDLALEVQTAVYQRLAEDAVLVGLIGLHATLGTPRIFDHVPDDQELGQDPDDTDACFIQIGDYSAVDAGDKSDPGQEGVFDIYCWSRSKGNVQALTIARQVVRLLHEKPLPLEVGEAPLVRCQFSAMMRDPDGKSRKAIRRFRIITSDPPSDP